VVKGWKKAIESASMEQDMESDDSWVTESSVSDDSEDEIFSSTGVLLVFLAYHMLNFVF